MYAQLKEEDEDSKSERKRVAELEMQVINEGPEFGALDRLPSDHIFSWEMCAADPKRLPPYVSYRGDWFKTLEYNLLHTGGFLRLSTDRGRVYWCAQNEQFHTTPDWKLHFSCELEDIPTAWNILACLFMQLHCEVGMKATVATQYDTDSPSHRGDAQEEGEEEPVRQLSWPAGQRGREITVYIFKYCHQYGNGPMDNLGDPGTNHIYHLSPEFEAGYDSAFWFDFIRRAERALATAGVRSRGTADGDLALPTCRYASLRNEAFCMAPSYSHPVSDCNSASHLNRPADTHVELEDLSVPVPVPVSVPDQHRQEMQYPPNNKGWNAAGHFNPLSRVISCLQTLSDELTYRGVMS